MYPIRQQSTNVKCPQLVPWQEPEPTSDTRQKTSIDRSSSLRSGEPQGATNGKRRNKHKGICFHQVYFKNSLDFRPVQVSISLLGWRQQMNRALGLGINHQLVNEWSPVLSDCGGPSAGLSNFRSAPRHCLRLVPMTTSILPLDFCCALFTACLIRNWRKGS